MKKVPEDLAAKLYDVGDRFLAQGPDVRIDQVAEDAGIPRATLYYYFSGKDDIVTFLMNEKLQRVAASVEKARAGEGAPIERFEAALNAVTHDFASNPALCLNMVTAMGRIEAMAEMMFAADRAAMAPLRELLIEARALGEVEVVDIDLTVSVFVGAINVAVLSRHAMGVEIDPDALAGLVVPQLLNGITAR
jgi:TetR/AcrR family transcriptional regulator